jgi:hypothetical protein
LLNSRTRSNLKGEGFIWESQKMKNRN